MIVLTMLNQKGGVGKTSLCHHLAGELARRGRRVLLVDYDPQASLTQGLLGSEATNRLAASATAAAIPAGSAAEPGRLVRESGIAGVDLVAGARSLGRFNTAEPESAGAARSCKLRDFLRGVAGRYDLALIDCPPNLHLCSWSALVAADALLIPIQAEDYGSQGLSPVLEFLGMVRAVNPALRPLGIVLNMIDRRLSVHKVYEKGLREEYGEAVFDAVVPRAAAMAEAIMHRLPVSHHAPRSAAAASIQALCDEVCSRLDGGPLESEEVAGVQASQA